MTTLRTAAQLCDHGFVPDEKRAGLDAVAARYAVALPQALAELIDPNDPNDPIARQFVPDAAELNGQPQELADPIGDDAHSPVEGIVHRYPDRVLLKLTAICAVYCRFCFRRETVGPGKANALPAAALERCARLHPQPAGNLGGDPHRRRSAGAVAAPSARRDEAAGRDRARQSAAHPYARSGGGAGARDGGTGAGDQGQGQADLRGAAHQPSARIDARRARGLRPHGGRRARAARAIGAAGRRQRHAGGVGRSDAGSGRMPDQAVLPAPRRSRARHGAFAHRHRDRAGTDACPARTIVRAYVSRLTCSISPAATANRRSVRTISRRPDRTAPRIS